MPEKEKSGRNGIPEKQEQEYGILTEAEKKRLLDRIWQRIRKREEQGRKEE
jgi:hypothetical protein